MRVLAPVCVFDEEEDEEEDGAGAGAAAASAASAGAAAVSAEEEMEKRVRLRAQYYEGTIQKVRGEAAVVQYDYTPEGLAGQSIVLATYDTLRKDGGHMLKKLHWHRVVVDECQELRMGTSQVRFLGRRGEGGRVRGD